MDILIHGCWKRLKYLEGYLAKKLPKAHLMVDYYGEGNIEAYRGSYRVMYLNGVLPKTGNTWHLEDDVLPDRRIMKWMRELESREGIICGFGTTEIYGEVEPEDMWYSFPCIRIPNDYLIGFEKWLYHNWMDEDVAMRVAIGKGIDFLFRKYVIQNPIPIYHHNPCMVEHIDEYIGGSLINERDKPIKAIRFEDTERLAELKDWVKEN